MTYEQEQRVMDNCNVEDVTRPGPYPIEIRLKSNSVGRGFRLCDAVEQAVDAIDKVEATVKIVGKGRGTTAADAIQVAIGQISESVDWGR